MNFDLYRLFFPVGWLLGFFGALVWVLYFFNLIPYPGSLHPEIMMGGFLLSFVMGFLGTAAPKFTNSYPATKNEIKFSLFLAILLFVSQIFSNELYFRLCSLSVFVFLIYFLLMRFRARTANPPPPFVFVGAGVLTGTLGSIFLILSKLNYLTDDFYILGRMFFHQAFILSFVLGIGSRLIPSLLGFAPPPNMQQKSVGVKVYSILAALFILTYIIEVFISKTIGYSIRDIVFIYIALAVWKIYQLPKRKSIQAFGLWISCLFMVVGYVSASLFENYYIHLMHLFYISGLSLMTLMVATRVTLSHGGHDIGEEIKSKYLIATVALFILAALTRMSAGFMPERYLTHLHYAACVWILGLIIWGVSFLPKIIKIKL